MLERPARRTTARRIAGAFGLVLLLFGLALVVIVISLAKIGGAERDVARLDHAKHAGHHAAAMAREQYMHQAHTMLAWNDSHLGHYARTAAAARQAAEHLAREVAGQPGEAQARQIAELIAENDRQFREEVLPAIQRDDRTRMPDLNERTEELVERVVDLNTQLNEALEQRSESARKDAERIRATARIAVLACFALAIAAAAAVGFHLLRSISRPVAALRAGAMKIGAGDLSVRIDMRGDDELADLARVFDQMAADLGRHQAELLDAHRLASIGQVASGVAHELNNPLGVILGYLTLLRRSDDREELRIIEDETRQAQAIVAGLLELARPVRLDRSEVDLHELAREVIARLEETGRASGVAVRLTDERAPRVDADEGKLRQIALNLIENAVEACREAGTHAPLVEIHCRERDGRVWLDVEDRGPGIPPETRARVFEPFFTTRSRGHGLGLAIARSLARAHGGDIRLEPREGGGTRASLWLPLPATGKAAA